MLRAGDVVRIFDKKTDPPKTKRHICISPTRRLFLRINSDPLWPPNHPLTVLANPSFLDHDSFVELRALSRFTPAEVADALRRPDNLLGRLSKAEAEALAWSAKQAPTLSTEHQDLIWDSLCTNWPDEAPPD